MSADPNGINYPADQELRNLLAEELRKLQYSTPERAKTADAAKHWHEYTASVVQRLSEGIPERKTILRFLDGFDR